MELFKYHLEKAIEDILKSSEIDYVANPVAAKMYVKNNIYTLINNNLNQAIDNLLPK